MYSILDNKKKIENNFLFLKLFSNFFILENRKLFWKIIIK